MGAAAFLMAEYLQVPYAEVMVAAIIPAFLYYAALFMQVDLESAKLGIAGAPRESLPKASTVLRQGWHFPIPFVVLVGGLIWANMEAEYAALLATGVLIVLALTVPHKGRRLGVREVASAVVSAGGAVIDIIAITAIAGILIGVLNLTGVAFSLTQQLLTISGGSLPLLLLVTAVAAFILGLPLPTVGVYVILATLAAPALVQAGISPMQAHLFVLFQGILGMVTPPVALAAFAAATIARSDQWRTGWTSTRMSWCAYFIPFLFAYSPALIMRGDPLTIVAARGDRPARHPHGNHGCGRLFLCPDFPGRSPDLWRDRAHAACTARHVHRCAVCEYRRRRRRRRRNRLGIAAGPKAAEIAAGSSG